MVVGAEKSHSLPSANWKTRKAGGIIDLESKDPNFPGGASGKELAYQCRRCRRCSIALGREAPLEEGMATHSSILAWEILWTEEPGGL